MKKSFYLGVLFLCRAGIYTVAAAVVGLAWLVSLPARLPKFPLFPGAFLLLALGALWGMASLWPRLRHSPRFRALPAAPTVPEAENETNSSVWAKGNTLQKARYS